MKLWRSSHPRLPLSLLAVALAGLTWAGCSDQAADSPTSPASSPDLSARSGAAATLQQQDLGPALAAQKRYGDQLMATPGIIGHGVGLVDGEPGIRVFLLNAAVAGVPSRLDDVPVAVEVTGMFVAGATTDKLRPAPNGYSIGHPNITAGTLGTIVRATSDNQCYILSNNHVLANSNNASIGDNTLQPGPYDGGQDPADAIASLAAFEPLAFDGSDNRIDAAISALFSPADATGSTPGGGYGASGTTPVGAVVGQNVQKFGRTTLLSSGEVTEISVTANVCYQCSGPFCFRCTKLAHFVDLVATTDMSEGGDSGSLTVTNNGNKNPVGLLFAGSSTRTLHNRIDLVLDHFGVAVETDMTQCANGGTPVDDPPSVSITEPSEGATVSGSSVTVTADASDDGLVTQVEFFADGSSIGIDTDGSGGWSVLWDTTAEADGSYELTATATDDASTPQSTTSDPVNVTVNNSTPAPSTMHVGDLDTSKNVKGRSGKWEGFATVTVHDESHSPVANATVSVSWIGTGAAANGSASGVTGTDGTVTIGTGNIDGNGSVTFTVDGVTHSSLTYDSSANHDPDGSNWTVSHP